MLLLNGCDYPVRNDDVEIWPVKEGKTKAVRILFKSAEGQPCLQVEERFLLDFLDDCAEAVPYGEEEQYFDVELLIQEIRPETNT